MKRLAALLLLLAACGGDDAGSAPDATVCELPAAGACDGNVVQRCDGDALVTEDCGTDTCALDGDAYACVDLCAAAGATTTPACVDNAIVSCVLQDGRNVVVTDACAVGSLCDDSGGAPACVSDPCAAVGPQGACAGDTLTACAGGQAVTTDCTTGGDVCAYVDDATGYGCVDPGATGAMVVSGLVRYEDKAPQPSGALGPLTPVLARGAVISVIHDGDNAVLATAIVSDDGSYTLRYDTTLGDPVHVTATASSPLAIRPIRVRRTMTATHAFGGASFPAAAATTFDLLVTDSSATSEAFNILDQMITGMDTIRAVYGDPAPPALTVRWSRGSNDGTYYGNNQIHLLGQTSDDDGYDDTVMLHEFGHYVEDAEGHSDNPGGGHDGSPDDPRLAWSEGFSTYFSMVTYGQPIYMDSNSGGGWGWDGDESVTAATMPTGAVTQDVSEDMVCEDLWDLGDGGAGDDDPHAGGHVTTLRVQEYLRAGGPRGVDGVDLVDALDGWFVQNGLGTCTPVASIVTGVRKFPYDYAGPGGSCP